MVNRRRFLKGLGVCIALPLLESAYPSKWARAQATGGAPKKRFIGCFFGSGAPMPDAANGEWRYGAALQPLQDLGVSGNVSVLRGFRAVNKFDVHWSGTASFLSSQEISMSNASNPFADPNYQRCAKSFDQFIADTAPGARIRSLHAGFNQLPGWDDAHDRTVSIHYVNSIAWRDERTPISNIMAPAQMFTQVFGAGGSVANAQAQYLLKRRQSILDGVLDQYKHHKAGLSTGDQAKLEAYAQSIREVEGELSNAARGTSCARPPVEAGSDAYIRNFRTMQKIIIAAMQCDLTRAATIMYNDGIGSNQPTSTVAAQQHDSAHNNWATLVQINRVQVQLWGELVAGLRAANLLGETVTVLGSNMSDGRTHNPANVPLLVASQNVGNEMRLGQDIQGTAAVTDFNQNRNLSDLYVDLFRLYGQNRSFGAGGYASTGRASGVLA